MTRSSKGKCGWCGARRCLRCGHCPNNDCENYMSCDRPLRDNTAAIRDAAQRQATRDTLGWDPPEERTRD